MRDLLIVPKSRRRGQPTTKKGPPVPCHEIDHEGVCTPSEFQRRRVALFVAVQASYITLLHTRLLYECTFSPHVAGE